MRYHVEELETEWNPFKPKERNGYLFTSDLERAKAWAQEHRPAVIMGGGRVIETVR